MQGLADRGMEARLLGSGCAGPVQSDQGFVRLSCHRPGPGIVLPVMTEASRWCADRGGELSALDSGAVGIACFEFDRVPVDASIQRPERTQVQVGFTGPPRRVGRCVHMVERVGVVQFPSFVHRRREMGVAAQNGKLLARLTVGWNRPDGECIPRDGKECAWTERWGWSGEISTAVEWIWIGSPSGTGAEGCGRCGSIPRHSPPG